MSLRHSFSRQANGDVRKLLKRSVRLFGIDAAERYAKLIDYAAGELEEDPHRLGVKKIRPYSFYHLRHCKKKAGNETGYVETPRHILVFRVVGDELRILRVLHDSMDPGRHLP